MTRVGAATIASVISIISFIIVLYAWEQVEQRAREVRLAFAGQLALQSQAVHDIYPQRSLPLAVEALEITRRESDSRVPSAEEALRQALASSGGRVFGGHEDRLFDVAISPDGRWLVTVSRAGTRIWDLTVTEQASKPIFLQGEGRPIAISPDSHWLVTSSGATMRLWNLIGKEPSVTPIVRLDHEEKITAVAVSPDSRWLATASGRTTRLWGVAENALTPFPIILPGHTMPITAMAFSPDGNWLATGSGGSDVSTGADDPIVRLWNIQAPKLVMRAVDSIPLRGDEGPIGSIAFSPDGHWLVTGGGMGIGLSSRQDRSLRVWDLRAQDPASHPRVFAGPDTLLRRVAMSRDNRWLIAISDDALHLWDFRSLGVSTSPTYLKDPNLPLPDYGVSAVSADGQWVALSNGTTMRLWNVSAEEPLSKRWAFRGHEEGIGEKGIAKGGITAVAFSPDA